MNTFPGDDGLRRARARGVLAGPFFLAAISPCAHRVDRRVLRRPASVRDVIRATAPKQAPAYNTPMPFGGFVMLRITVLAVTFALFTGLASLSVYGAAAAPGAVAFDGYDHSLDAASVARGDGGVEAGY